MLIPVQSHEFKGGDESKVLKATVVVAGRINRLFVPAHVAIDFVICKAILKYQDQEKTCILIADGDTHCVLFSETSFGMTPMYHAVDKGDVIEIEVRCVIPVTLVHGPTRIFFGAWDIIEVRNYLTTAPFLTENTP